MLIQAGYTIEIQCPQTTPVVLMLSVHPSIRDRLLSEDRIQVRPPMFTRVYRDCFGNICHRLHARAGVVRLHSEFLLQDSGEVEELPTSAEQHPVDRLPDDVLQFLLPSRYCDTEKLMGLAWDRFGHLPEGWPRVEAVLDYVHRRIRFGYQFASPTRTAFEAHEEQRGVCRDFAHLAVALFRCLNIPARYVNGYLGDIGVPPVDSPMDFSAWCQLWMGGQWWDIDARHNQPRIGRILIAAGRDAADVAMITAFGASRLSRFEVQTQELADAQPGRALA